MSPTSYRTAPPRAKVQPSSSPPKTSDAFVSHTSNLKSEIWKSEIGLVGLGRVELPTSRLSGVRSNQLSYRPSSPLRPFLPQKRATLLFCGPLFTVDTREGRVASVAIQDCLRS